MFILIIISVMLACAPFIIMSSGPCTFTEMLRV